MGVIKKLVFYAIKHNYDIVALIHGDGQYAPECLDQLLDPINNSNADVVFGSRMLTRFGALKGICHYINISEIKY